jgi:hypothetical protein
VDQSNADGVWVFLAKAGRISTACPDQTREYSGDSAPPDVMQLFGLMAELKQ